VAGHATHAALGNGVMILQANLGLLVQVTLETSFGIFARIDNELAASTSGIHMFAARSVAGLASLRRGTFTFARDLHPRVQRELERLRFLMARRAGCRTHKPCAGYHRRR